MVMVDARMLTACHPVKQIVGDYKETIGQPLFQGQFHEAKTVCLGNMSMLPYMETIQEISILF